MVLNGAQYIRNCYCYHGSTRRRDKPCPKWSKGDCTAFDRKVVYGNRERFHTSVNTWRREEDQNYPHYIVNLWHVRVVKWGSSVDRRDVDQRSNLTKRFCWGVVWFNIWLAEKVNFLPNWNSSLWCKEIGFLAIRCNDSCVGMGRSSQHVFERQFSLPLVGPLVTGIFMVSR